MPLSLLVPSEELLRISHLRSQQPQLPSDPYWRRRQRPEGMASPKSHSKLGSASSGPALSLVLSTQESGCTVGVLPTGPATPTPSMTAASTSAEPGDPHHKQLPALCVPSGHPGESPTPFSAAYPQDPLTCQPSQLLAQEGTPSEPYSLHQVPSDFQLQILPGDEIVQVNEQVVVSEEERDMVGVKG